MEPLPEKTETIAPSTSKKSTRKSLKQLLQSKPAFDSVEDPQPSTSNTTFEHTSNKGISEENEYVLRPVGPYTFFDDSELHEYYEDFRSSATDRVFVAYTTHLNNIDLKFKKNPVVRNNYTQYSLVNTVTMAVATNVYGFVIGNSENFTDRTTLPSLSVLEAKHRVSLLLPTAEFWWNKNSAAMFMGFIQKVGTAIKSLAMDEEFKTSMDRFHQNKDVLINFKNKYLSATKVINCETVPAVFGVKVYNSNQFNSEIALPMAQIMNDNSLEESDGYDLVPPTYMHALVLLAMNGFKITRSGISLDMEVNYLLYRKFERAERRRLSGFSLQKHIINPKRGNSFSTSLNSSISNLSDFEEEPNKKKINRVLFS